MCALFLSPDVTLDPHACDRISKQHATLLIRTAGMPCICWTWLHVDDAVRARSVGRSSPPLAGLLIVLRWGRNPAVRTIDEVPPIFHAEPETIVGFVQFGQLHALGGTSWPRTRRRAGIRRAPPHLVPPGPPLQLFRYVRFTVRSQVALVFNISCMTAENKLPSSASPIPVCHAPTSHGSSTPTRRIRMPTRPARFSFLQPHCLFLPYSPTCSET